MTRTQKLALLLVPFATCGSLTRITVTQTASTTIQGATFFEQLAGSAFAFGGFGNFDITQSQELANQGVKREQINTVKLKSLTLTVTSPATGQDFTFLEGVQFFVEADGLEKKEVARGGPFSQGATTVNLTVLDVDLAPYAAAPSMTFTTTAKGQKPSNTTTIEATIVLDVDVNVGGVICGAK